MTDTTKLRARLYRVIEERDALKVQIEALRRDVRMQENSAKIAQNVALNLSKDLSDIRRVLGVSS